MPKILIVDDNQSMRRLLRMRLADAYEIIDTGVVGARTPTGRHFS